MGPPHFNSWEPFQPYQSSRAPRLTFSISFGSKKKEPYVSFGVPSKGALPREPPHWASSKRDAPFLEPPTSLKLPGRWASFWVPQRGPYGYRHPSPEPFLPILQGPQQGTPPSRFPSQSSHRERCPTPRAPFSYLSKSLEDKHTPGCPA
jgi:hypothetical protein